VCHGSCGSCVTVLVGRAYGDGHRGQHSNARSNKVKVALIQTLDAERPPVAVTRIQAIQDYSFKDLVDPREQSVRVLRVAAVPGTENFLQVCFLQANPPPNQKNRNQQ